jgi:hypothetical protein
MRKAPRRLISRRRGLRFARVSSAARASPQISGAAIFDCDIRSGRPDLAEEAVDLAAQQPGLMGQRLGGGLDALRRRTAASAPAVTLSLPISTVSSAASPRRGK